MESFQTTARDHMSGSPAMTLTGRTWARIQPWPTGMSVSIACAKAVAPRPLTCPAPCARASYGRPCDRLTVIAVYCSTALSAFGVSPAVISRAAGFERQRGHAGRRGGGHARAAQLCELARAAAEKQLGIHGVKLAAIAMRPT